MKAIILAAGKGTRLNSDQADLPKAMRKVLDRPILEYVFDTLNFIDEKDLYVIVKYKKEKIVQAYPNLCYIEQGDDGYGTGYAVECAEKYFENYDGEIVVICGDTPLISQNTIKKMINMHREENNACTVLSCIGEKGLALGRMIRDESGRLLSITEAKDCTKEQFDNVNEYNAATYIFDSKELFNALKKVENSVVTKEKYLTDVPSVLLASGKRVNAYISEHSEEILGVNSIEDLKLVENTLLQRKKVSTEDKK